MCIENSMGNVHSDVRVYRVNFVKYMYTTWSMAFVVTEYLKNLFQMVVTEEIKNLRRLEAQRNELNAKGRCEFSFWFYLKSIFY